MPDIELPHTSRGRLHPSAQASPGMVLLVPRPVIDEEQQQLMQMIVDARVQQLIIHLRRGGIKHLDVNEMLQRGEYKGFTPMHVAVMRGTSSIVAALLELANADAWRCLGEALQAQGLHQEAINAFRKAKQFDPADRSLDAAIDRSQQGVVADFLRRHGR